MKAVILAGGFGKRMWPLTLHVPKALLPIAGKPAIDYQIEQLVSVNDIDQIIISTNLYFENSFRRWWAHLPSHIQDITAILVEPSNGEHEKLGSVRGLKYVVDTEPFIESEWIVIAGDNLFGFRLNDFVQFYKQSQSPTVAFYEMEDGKNKPGEYGFGILDQDARIDRFEEKPLKPISRLISTGCYIFPASISTYLQDYIHQNGKHDQMGDFIDWLRKQNSVYGFVFRDSWFDIGSHGSYEDANKYYVTQTFSLVQDLV